MGANFNQQNKSLYFVYMVYPPAIVLTYLMGLALDCFSELVVPQHLTNALLMIIGVFITNAKANDVDI